MNYAKRCLENYRRHLHKNRNLAVVTVRNYVSIAAQFLERRFGGEELCLSDLQSSHVIDFIRCEAQRLKGSSRMKTVATGLRSFLRFVHADSSGEVEDLSGFVPGVASRALTSVPRAIADEAVEKVLNCINRTTVKGQRDHAILLLIARLGLRAVEVARLTLEDIDWRHATLTVTQKGGHRSVHPLTEPIGEALADYLKTRPRHSADRRVFLRLNAPVGGFDSSSSICTMVRNRLKQAGVDSPTLGTHQFRHGLATRMLHGGASLHEIGDVLGHRNPAATMIYAKVDVEALRSIAMPWPGGVQ